MFKIHIEVPKTNNLLGQVVLKCFVCRHLGFMQITKSCPKDMSPNQQKLGMLIEHRWSVDRDIRISVAYS